MTLVKGKIVKGGGIATQTVQKQSPFFKERGLDLYGYFIGTINMDISPRVFEVTNPDFDFRNIIWEDDFSENFKFVEISIMFEGNDYSGYLYNPSRSINHSGIMEILTVFIDGVENGKFIEIDIPESRVEFKQPGSK